MSPLPNHCLFTNIPLFLQVFLENTEKNNKLRKRIHKLCCDFLLKHYSIFPYSLNSQFISITVITFTSFQTCHLLQDTPAKPVGVDGAVSKIAGAMVTMNASKLLNSAVKILQHSLVGVVGDLRHGCLQVRRLYCQLAIHAANDSIATSLKGNYSLGRPWNDLHYSVYMDTWMDASILPTGYTTRNNAAPYTTRSNCDNSTTMAAYRSSRPGFNQTAWLAAGCAVLMILCLECNLLILQVACVRIGQGRIYASFSHSMIGHEHSVCSRGPVFMGFS